MSKNTNLSFLTDYITADITNGRIGINNASPAVAFDVVGATKITGVLTLTGALSGTSATFSNSVTSSLGSSAANFNSNGATTGSVNAYRVSNTTGVGSLGIDNSVGGDLITGGLAYATILQSISNTALQLGTNQTARITITSAGNVGIGTSSPNGPLSVQANTGNTAIRLIGTSQSSSNNAGIYWYDSNDSTFNGYLGNFSGSFDIYNHRSTPMVFSTAATERMRITSGGNVLINKTTASGFPLEVEVFSDGNLAYFTRQGANTKMFMDGTTAGATAFYIQSNTTNGVYLTAGGTSWTANSDIRLKNIISPIDSAVDKLSTLNPVIFSWKSDDTNKENIGLIAQDVANVFPQAIDTNKDGFLGVRYVELVPVLVKAIQEQQVQIQELSAKVSLLENK